MQTLLVLLVLSGIALSLAVPRESYSNDGKKIKYRFQYAASFACGSNSGSDSSLINGDYSTTVTIHNPMEKGTANIRKKIALSFPSASSKDGGRISNFVMDSLNADEAVQVDCGEILGEGKQQSEFFGGQSVLTGKNTYAQGYLIIESDVSVDVDRVTTAGNTETTQVPVPKKQAPPKKRVPGYSQQSQQQQHRAGAGAAGAMMGGAMGASAPMLVSSDTEGMMTVTKQNVVSTNGATVQERKLKK